MVSLGYVVKKVMFWWESCDVSIERNLVPILEHLRVHSEGFNVRVN